MWCYHAQYLRVASNGPRQNAVLSQAFRDVLGEVCFAVDWDMICA